MSSPNVRIQQWSNRSGRTKVAIDTRPLQDWLEFFLDDIDELTEVLAERALIRIQKEMRRLARANLKQSKQAYLDAIGPIEVTPTENGATASFTFAEDASGAGYLFEDWLAARVEKGGPTIDLKEKMPDYLWKDGENGEYIFVPFLHKESAMSAHSGGRGAPIGYAEMLRGYSGSQAADAVRSAVRGAGRDFSDMSLPPSKRMISPDTPVLQNRASGAMHRTSIYAGMYRIEQARSSSGKVLRRSAKYETMRTMKKDGQEGLWMIPAVQGVNFIAQAVATVKPVVRDYLDDTARTMKGRLFRASGPGRVSRAAPAAPAASTARAPSGGVRDLTPEERQANPQALWYVDDD